jgi:nucleoside-diphosphate-sugar epimerase
MRIRKTREMAAAFAALMMAVGSAAAEGVLVFGGTGQLGAPHVRMLIERGETVTVFHRSTSSFKRLEGLAFDKAEGDLLDAATVLATMEKAKPRVVIDTSARRGERLQSRQPFYTQAMRNIVAAAKATGVEQIIIHSSVGVRDSAPYLAEVYGYNTDSANMKDKADAEIALENSGINYTIVRNGLLEHEPAPPTGRGRLTEDQNTFGRITRTDLTRISLECMDNPDCYGKIYHAQDDQLSGPRPASGGSP